jgi:hypothetical protein
VPWKLIVLSYKFTTSARILLSNLWACWCHASQASCAYAEVIELILESSCNLQVPIYHVPEHNRLITYEPSMCWDFLWQLLCWKGASSITTVVQTVSMCFIRCILPREIVFVGFRVQNSFTLLSMMTAFSSLLYSFLWCGIDWWKFLDRF